MNATQATQHYIKAHPHVRKGLRQGIVNHSALARVISEQYQLDSSDAALMAIRRFPLETKEERQEELARDLLRRAKLVLRTKIVVVTVEKKNALHRALTLQQLIVKNNGDFRLIEGEETFSIISTEDYLSAIEESFRAVILKRSKNLTQVTLIFPEQIATTVGVCSYLYTLLAENGINIREEMSCWKDVMIVVSADDAPAVVELLQQ